MLQEGETLRPNARILWEIQARAMRPPVETATNLYDGIRARAASCLETGRMRRDKAANEEQLRAYQRECRRLFLECIGWDRLPRERGRASVLDVRDYPDFRLEKLLLEPGKGNYATANVYVPKSDVKPLPAVLLVIGHTDLGKADGEYQFLARQLVRQGLIVLALDPLGEGERFEHYEEAIDLQPIQGCSGEHDLMDWKCKLLGHSLAAWFVRDGLCALDYLASRPDVDADRIGLTGHSGGGTQVSMLMLAAGERFACAAPCAYVTDARAMLEEGVDPDNEMIWPGSLKKGLDYVDLLAGMAPKPVTILACRHDFFPPEGTLRTFEEAKKLWAAGGREDALRLVWADSSHAYAPSLACAAADFFSRTLLGKAAAAEQVAFEALKPGELSCFPGGTLLGARADMRTLQDELAARLDALKAGWTGDAEALAGELKEILNCAQVRPGQPRVYAEGICGHYAWRSAIWRPGADRWSNGVFLRDMRADSEKLPTVIALWPGGLSRLAEHSNRIWRMVRAGRQVLVMDVSADGSLLPAALGSSGMYIGWGTMYKLSAYLIQLGDSLCAMRTRDVIAACHMADNWPEADGVSLYAQGDMGRYVLLAALLCGVPVCTDGEFQRYEEIVLEKYHDQTNTHSWILPGALRLGDMDAISECLSKRGLLLRDPAAMA